MASGGQHQHLFKEIRFKMPCLMLWKLVLVFLSCISCNTVSFPITDKETGRELNAYMYMGNGSSHSGRTLMQTDDFFDECEFGNNLQNYDETCPGGATGLIPCNPGQLKVAECIGQDGDTSRMCDPCPQKFYQSFYNKCTRCHQCSECGPNEEISDPCTDETDTVCRSIIPPDPVTATSPAPDTTTKSQPQTQTTATTTASTTCTQQSVVSTVSPSVVTYGNVDSTTEILRPETTTGGIEEPIPPVTSYKDTCVDGIVLAVIASIFILVLLILVVVLFYICWKQRREINRLQKMLASSESSQSPPNQISSPSDEPGRDLEPESSQGHHESSSTAQGTELVVDCPDDEKTWVGRFLSPVDVVKDAIKGLRKKKGKAPHVTFHKVRSESGPSQSVDLQFKNLPSDQRTNIKTNNGSNNGESLGPHQPTPPGGRRVNVESGPLNEKVPGSTDAADGNYNTHHQAIVESAGAVVEPHPWNEKVPASTHTAEVHRDSQNIPGERGRGDGDSLVTRDVVRDSQPSHNGDAHNPDSVDPNDLASHSGQDVDAVHWLAEKVPRSTSFASTCTDGNESDIEVPEVDSEERWHAEKVPGAFISNDSGTTVQDMVTDAPPDEPRTLHSRRNPQAPIADEEEYEEAVGTNTNGANAPTEDTQDDVLQRLTEPETTAGNDNEVNATVHADTDTSADEDEDRKPWNQRVLKLFTKGKRKNNKRRKDHTRQMQQLITMDIMVEERGLEYVADNVKLATLDKLCRVLGITDTVVANYKYELKSEQYTGAELVFKMLLKVRGLQGGEFTYRKLDKALRLSNNVHVADGMVSMIQL